MKPFHSSIEPLEARIAPAMATLHIVNPSTATYTDVDGDLVAIKVSAGTLVAGDFTGAVGAHGDQLEELNLSGGGFSGANVTFSVVKVAGGDGLANVGFIDAVGSNLGTVTVKGDLGRIDAGSGSATPPAIKSLSVNSMGRLGTDTQVNLTSPNLESDISGNLGSLKIAHDDNGAFINVTNGGIGAVTIGGSLLGGANNFSGEIASAGDLGPVKIGQDVQGGSGFQSGYIRSFGKLAGVSIGGSLLGGAIYITGDVGAVKIGHDVQGGSLPGSGLINSAGNLAGVSIGGSLIGGQIHSAGDMGAVKIGNDMQGGSGIGSGYIYSSGKLAGVSIGGSLIGGSNIDSGEIYSAGDMGAVKIGGNFTGGSISGTTAALDSSGLIISTDGNIASVSIGGSIISGTDTSTGGALTNNASIRAAYEIGTLTVGGSIIGNSDGATGNAASPVVISALGQTTPVAPNDMAIGKITVGGRVEDAVILAGYNTSLAGVGNGQIGAVKVGGDWIASDLVAGATNSNLPADAPFPNFGTASDSLIAGGIAGIIPKIASITIGGEVFGTPASVNATDNFGFVSAQIGSVKIGGNTIVVPTNSTPLAIGETGDVDIHIV